MRIRGSGTLYLPTYRSRTGERKTAGVYWWKLGKVRVSTGCRAEDEAQAWVVERLVQMRRGHLVGVRAKPPAWDDLERGLIDRWELDGRRGMLQCMSVLRRLRRAFAGWPAAAITSDRITSYAAGRRRDGAAAATVNLELAVLRRAFGLAREAGLLDLIPPIHRLTGVNHRTGTVDPGDLDAIERALESRYADVIEALYWTGWREGEILRLTWQRVDLAACEIRLDASKTGEPRVLCFASVPALVTLFREAHRRRGFSPYVFPGRAGRPIDRTTLQKHWRAACRACRLPDTTLIHDLRRTAVRDMRRAGVPLAVAMGAVGHRSLDVHQGYSVVARQDQDDGMARLVALRSGEPVQRRLAVMGG